MYLGGQRVFFPGEQGERPDHLQLLRPAGLAGAARRPIPTCNTNWSIWRSPSRRSARSRTPDLLEVALGGPGHHAAAEAAAPCAPACGAAADCAPAWNTAVDRWAAEGLAVRSGNDAAAAAGPRCRSASPERSTNVNLCDPMAKRRLSGHGQPIDPAADRPHRRATPPDLGLRQRQLPLPRRPRQCGSHHADAGRRAAGRLPHSANRPVVEILRTGRGARAGAGRDRPVRPGPDPARRCRCCAASCASWRSPYGPVPGSTGNVSCSTDASAGRRSPPARCRFSCASGRRGRRSVPAAAR